MKKRLFAGALSLVMLLSLLPTAAFANETDASTLQAAINSISGSGNSTIKLEKEYKESITIAAGQTITLDLNGYTLTNADNQHTITNNGTLTIIDSSANKTGKVDNVSHVKGAVYNNTGATCTILGGQFTRSQENGKTDTNNGDNSWYVIKNFGTMTIGQNKGSDADVKVFFTSAYSSLIANGWQNAANAGSNGEPTHTQDASLTVYSGTFENGLNTIKNDDYGQLTIYGGQFKNVAQHAVMNWNVAAIHGGTFESTGKPVVWSTFDHETMDKGELTITGGTFTAPANQYLIYRGQDKTKGKLEISGGTFSSKFVSNGTFLAQGSAPIIQTNGTCVVSDQYDGLPSDSNGYYYENTASAEKNSVAVIVETGKYASTLAAAVSSAQSGETVKLLKDVTLANYISIRKKITLDLNGHDVTFSGNYGFPVYSGGDLNLTGTGTIQANYCALSMTGAATDDNTTCVATVGEGVTLSTVGTSDNYAVIIWQNDTNGKDASYGVDLTVNGTLKGDAGIFVLGNIKKTDGSIPKIYLNKTAKVEGTSIGIAINGYADVTVDGATITGSSTTAGTGIEIRAGKLTVSSGTITGNGVPVTVGPNGSGTTSRGCGVAVSQHATKLPINVTISGGEINGYSALYQSNPQENTGEDIGEVSMKVTGGAFNAINGGTVAVYSENCKGFIEGGIFSSDPSAYCVENKTGVGNTDRNTNQDYPFMIGVEGTNAAEVVAGTPTVVNKAGESNELAEAAATALKPSEDSTHATIEGAGIEAAAKDIANKNTETGDSYENQLANAENINIVVQHYMDIQVMDASNIEGEKSITLDITPMYRKVATTVDPTNEEAEEIVTEGSSRNAVPIETGKLNITGPVTITLPLPSDFWGESAKTAYVQHKGYEYTATVKDNAITFVNPHGFSEFTITTTSETVAKIGDTSYTSLQAAVDAVKDGQTITLLKDKQEATVPNKTISFKVVSGGSNDYSATIKDYRGNTVTADQDGVYHFTRHSSSSGTTTYAVTTNSPANGTVAASPKSAAKNATVTLTVTPAEGYQLDKLTVTDKDGNVLTLTDKGNGKYTFVMPASKVDVSATFAKIPETHDCPSAHLTDVDITQWYHEGVDYVVSHGMMAGVTPTTFAPNDTTTRGMIVTILYRLEGSPAVTAANPFTDVAADQWYGNAVIWAAANGVVTGDTPTTFSPDDPITREQMAAILYRYAAFKGYDVTGRANLTGYTDAGQISDYAKEAMAWTNAENLIGGVSTTALQPQGSALRAQAATILMRFCQNVAK